MFTRLRRLGPGNAVGLMIVGAVVTVVLSGTAMAVTDTAFTYSTTQTGSLSIHPMDLAPRNSRDAGNFNIVYGEAYLYSPVGQACFQTGVHLPQNSSLTSVQTYYRATAGEFSAAVWVMRNNLSTDTTDELVYQQILDTDNVRRSVTKTVPSTLRTVRNNVYSYGYGICLGAGDLFEGARIVYTYRSAGD